MNAPKQLHLSYEALWACIADTVIRLYIYIYIDIYIYIMPKKPFFLVARNPSRQFPSCCCEAAFSATFSHLVAELTTLSMRLEEREYDVITGVFF